MDWSNLLSAGFGAGLTFAITVYGQQGAQRQAERLRRQAIEDEQRHRREERALHAAEAILDGVERAFDLGDGVPDELETTRRADELVRLLYHQMIYIPEPEVRRRLERCARGLSYFVSITGLRQDLSFPWAVNTVRKAIHDNLGPWLRGEELPEPSETFARLIEATDAADLDRYNAYLADRRDDEGKQAGH